MKSYPIKTLENEYHRNGYRFTFTDRVRNIAIFKQHTTGKVEYFEVFAVQVSRPRQLNGRTLEAKECPPWNEAWGTLGYTCIGIKNARAKMNELLNRSLKRSFSPEIEIEN